MGLFAKLENKTDATAINYKVSSSIDDICFDIRLQDLCYINQENGEMIDIEHKAVMTNNDEVLYVGRQYIPVSNSKIASSVKLYEDLGFKVSHVTNYRNRVFEINLVNDNYSVDVYGQATHPRICIKNSYDGSVALGISAGGIIQVCQNGLLSYRDLIDIKKRHTNTGAEAILFDKSYVDKTMEVLNNISTMKWRYSKSAEDMFEEIVKGIPSKDGLNPTINFLYSKYKEEYKNYSNDYFALFMAGTYVGTHGHKENIPYSYIKQIGERTCKLFLS